MLPSLNIYIGKSEGTERGADPGLAQPTDFCEKSIRGQRYSDFWKL